MERVLTIVASMLLCGALAVVAVQPGRLALAMALLLLGAASAACAFVMWALRRRRAAVVPIGPGDDEVDDLLAGDGRP